MRVLIVEDSNERMAAFRRGLIGARVRWANTAKKAMIDLEAHRYDVVFLDHDLHIHDGAASYDPRRTGTGTQVVQFLVGLRESQRKDKIRQHTLFVVHSLNPPGAGRMREMLRAAGYQAVCDPFAWNREGDLENLVESKIWNSQDRLPR